MNPGITKNKKSIGTIACMTGASGVVRLPLGDLNKDFSGISKTIKSTNINIKTDANYTFYLGYGEDYNDPSFVWNAEISKQFLKNKATLAIKVYDIMNQAKSVYRVTSDEYVMDVQTNALKRYVMLSFIYRFGDFGNNAGPRFGPPPRRR